MLGIKDNENKEAKGKQEKVSNAKLDKYMDKNSKRQGQGLLQKYHHLFLLALASSLL